MPEDKIKLMFKSGMPIRYTGKGPNPYVEDGGANAKGGAKESAPIVPAMDSGEKAKPATGSKNASLTVCSSDPSLPNAPFPLVQLAIADRLYG